jgi:hypothetical protein
LSFLTCLIPENRNASLDIFSPAHYRDPLIEQLLPAQRTEVAAISSDFRDTITAVTANKSLLNSSCLRLRVLKFIADLPKSAQHA